MYVQRYIVARSRNHCCHGNATMHSLFIPIGVAVPANNVKVFSVAMEIQQWIPLPCCPATKYFLPLLRNVHIKYYESFVLADRVAIYCYLWSVWPYRIVPHYLINGTIFGGRGGIIAHEMCVLIFCTNLV
jgi:hypothetical protein